jgi:hypothetical protein
MTREIRRTRFRHQRRAWGPGSAETAAILALAYDNAEQYWINPNEPQTDFLRALRSNADDISMLRFFTSKALTEIDWHLVQALQENPERLSGLIAELDIVRQVAVVHAMFAIAAERDVELGREPYLKRVKLPADLSLRVAETWEEVEEAMERWRALGISLKHEDVASLADYAERAIS